MHILIISPTKGEQLKNVRAVPRIGETVYLKGAASIVKDVIWWPPVEVLNKCQLIWQSCHVSELAGSQAIEAMIRVEQ